MNVETLELDREFEPYAKLLTSKLAAGMEGAASRFDAYVKLLASKTKARSEVLGNPFESYVETYVKPKQGKTDRKSVICWSLV